MNRISALKSSIALAIVATSGCVSGPPAASLSPLPGTRVDVRLDTGEADEALDILRDRAAGAVVSEAQWGGLFGTQGYIHLKEREAAMGRAFTDSDFKAFMTSDTLLVRAAELQRVLPDLRRLDVSAAAARALAYLPAGTRLSARLYLEIKPRPNTFVFTGGDSIPAIFLYVDPRRTRAQLENTIAHELHHIGLSSGCPDPPFTTISPARAMLLRYLGAFGEGQAMLAAAGSPDIHPHATDDDSIKARWNRDVSHASADIRELAGFFEAVLDGSVASADSVASRARTYYGVQGPWYTVGWLMASTIERELGRQALVSVICEPTNFLALYNTAAQRANAHGAGLPLWRPDLIERLLALRREAR
jgi:hypothetical protein